ncbi:MAG TPA: hypothetical protein VL240_12070 [Candidatus Binatia bacterium]|nr:hypothetical protein [Candidatus Binatia bacterium]
MKRLLLLMLIISGFAPLVAGQELYGSPIVIDLDGKNFDGAFTDVQHGVSFDFIHAGEPVEIAWTEPDRNIGFLVLNRHGDHVPGKDEHANAQVWFQVLRSWKEQAALGTAGGEEPVTFHVASGREMFGNLTNQPLSRQQGDEATAMAAKGEPWQPNGFLALGFFDRKENGGNGNGMIDAGDLVFSRLRVWVDTAHNGRSEDGKMYTLAELGIRFISLNYTTSERVDGYGNRMRYAGRMGMEDGRTAEIYDVFFRMIRDCPASK